MSDAKSVASSPSSPVPNPKHERTQTMNIHFDRIALRLGLLAGMLAALGTTPAFAQPDPHEASEPADVVSAPAVDPDAPIDLNAASVEELVTLPGVGPSRARAILEYRQRRPFARIEHIMRVPGIGRATFRRIRDRLRVAPRARRARGMSTR